MDQTIDASLSFSLSHNAQLKLS